MAIVRARRTQILAITVCAALLIAAAIIGGSAARSKNPTSDEPVHVLAGWIYKFRHDYRINPEHPILWKWIAALNQPRDAVRADFTSPHWQQMPTTNGFEWVFTVDTLFRTPGNDGEAFVNRSRLMMLFVGLSLGVLIALWAWKLAGPGAAVVAAFAYSLDPNFLAHAPLVTNDVPVTLTIFATVLAVWRLGRRVTLVRLLIAGVACAITVNMKFSSLLLGPIITLLLIARALLPESWIFFQRVLDRRASRFAAAVACGIVIAALTWLGTWAVYGFRFNPTPDPSVKCDMRQLMRGAAITDLRATHPEQAVDVSEIPTWRPNVLERSIIFIESHHLLPQAWLNGLVYSRQLTQITEAYLLGRVSLRGWWYYFPLVMLFKTPTATLIAMAMAMAMLIRWHLPARGMALRANLRARPDRWSLYCLLLPVAVYVIAALGASMNLGMRHLLPIFPYCFVLLGAVAGRMGSMRRGSPRWIVLVLAAVLAAESLPAYPNFIPFFNTAARIVGGSGPLGGGYALLGDSNLDWGQDLKLLAEWRRANPDPKLYLCYFGTIDPAFYHLNFAPLPGCDWTALPTQFPHDPGVIAISATALQGIYLPPQLGQTYRLLLGNSRPFQTLGGTIYLFHWPIDNSSR